MRFNPEYGSFLERAAAFVLANLLWVLLSIFILPLPAATAGLFAVFAPWVRGGYPELFSTFFGGMRQYWLRSSIIVIADIAIGALVMLNLNVTGLMNIEEIMPWIIRSVTLFFGLMTLMTNLYIWPLLVSFEMPFRRLVVVSIQLVFAHPLRSLLTLIAAAVPVFLSLLVPQIFLMVVTFAATAYVVNRGTWPIIKRYVPPEELEKFNEV